MNCEFELNGVVFVSDAAKAESNRAKHDVAFDHTAEAFFDPFLRLVGASKNEELRDAVIGFDATGRLLYVVHVEAEGSALRLVSARSATVNESVLYADS